MTELAARWDLGGWKRISHTLACVVGFDLWQVLAFGFMFGVLRLSPAEMWNGNPVVITTTVASGTLLMVCLVWLGIVRLGRVSWRELGWHTDRLGLSLGLGLLGAALMTAKVLGLLAVSGQLLPEVVATITGYTVEQRLLFLVIGAAAAATEESVFRGYLQPALIAKTGLVGGILIGAAVFALYHLFMGPGPLNLFSKFLGGVILGALRGRSNSLVAPLLAHFALWQIFGSL